jgi:SAM-dependent methyltransferase
MINLIKNLKLNFIKNKINLFKKQNTITKALIIIIILLLIIYSTNLSNNYKFGLENFDNNDTSYNLTNVTTFKYDFVYLKDNEAYNNSYYCKFYDNFFLNLSKNTYEIKYILNLSKNFNNNKILDIGCGTGNHVNLLSNVHKDTIGIDISPEMIKIAKERYPNNQFKLGDILNNNLFDSNDFTVITCLGMTIYDIIDKDTFFENCNSLLQTNGYLILHMVERDLFSPFVPPDDNTVLFNPQEYNRKRIFNTIVKIGDLEFSSNYEKINIIENNNTFNVPFSLYSEKIHDFKNNSIIKVDRNLYMPPLDKITNLAKSKNFSLEKKLDLKNINHENQYLYVFKKNN